MVKVHLSLQVDGCKDEGLDGFDIINAISNAIDDGFKSHYMQANIKEIKFILPDLKGDLND